MKLITKLLATCCLLMVMALPARVLACVDYHPNTVTVTVHYDATNFTDVSVTLGNLNIFGGQPNAFCSCAITNVTDVFTNILYVAFVDSGTINPVAGFDAWDASANASNAWENVLATGDWNGFVSMVNTAGLTPGNPVELLIRAQLPPGYTFNILDSNVVQTSLGTDEWSDLNQNLANTHQDISGVSSAPTYIQEVPNATWFQNIDNIFLVGRKDVTALQTISIYPVPAIDKLHVSLGNTLNGIQQIDVYDAMGKLMHQETNMNGGEAVLDVASLPQGVYFIKVYTASGIQTKRFVKAA